MSLVICCHEPSAPLVTGHPRLDAAGCLPACPCQSECENSQPYRVEKAQAREEWPYALVDSLLLLSTLIALLKTIRVVARHRPSLSETVEEGTFGVLEGLGKKKVIVKFSLSNKKE